MQLEFTRLILRDFKEYRGKHVVNLSSLGFGVHYIRGHNTVDALGSNGAGKSTLWDAFMWALCGRTVRGLRGTDVRTWEGDQHAMSRVDFYCDSDHHFVKRSTVKNGLWLDGKLCSQEEIDRLIGLSVVNIPHTIILGQKQDLFFDLKPSAKLDILSETLHLDRWEERSKKARDKAKDLEQAQASLEAQMAVLEETRTANLDLISKLKDKVQEWEKARAKSDEVRSEEQERLTKALADTIKESGTFDLAYDSAETELRAARRDQVKLNAEYLDAESRYAVKVQEYRAAKHELADLRALADSGECPTCGQVIADKKAHAKHAASELVSAEERMKSKRTLRDKAKTVRDDMAQVVERVARSILLFSKKSNEAKDKLDHLTERVSSIKQQIAVLKAQSREDEVNPYAEALTQARKQVKDAKQGIADAAELANKLSRRITRTKYWIDGFKQVRLYLLQETLEELQEVTQNMLPSLGLSGWVVEYAIERENKTGNVTTGLNVTILKPGMSKAVRWEAWSGGEGQRLLIAGALALSEVLLRRAGIECDMLVLDEPTRHMSREGIMETVDYLIERGRDAQIFYVDHAAIENNRFASVITIKKDEEGAHVNVE